MPWKSDDKSRNACTNSPGCLVAAKLYRKFGGENYLEDAKMLYKYIVGSLLKSDGRVEEPPLTYTQGTFGEACRQLYHITQEREYMRKAELVINYTMTSDRCLQNWILRDEGTNMDGSIFKAVFVPYAVNLALDDDTSDFVKSVLKLFCWTMPKHCGKIWIEENILLCIAIIIGVVCFLPMKLHPWGHRQVVAL